MWDFIGKLCVACLVSKLLWSLLKGLYSSFIATNIGLGFPFKKLGKWAVVTGATDGIGKAFAFELAEKGFDIVLISRTPFKLQNVAAEIVQKYNVKTKIVDVDFTDANIYERLESELANLDIGVLVNNVGMSYTYPEFFSEVDKKSIKDLLICNIFSVTMLTRAVLPAMRQRKRGLIINLSSLSSAMPVPFLSCYAASKAFVSSFSSSLSSELQGSGVEIQCVAPGFVVSNMSKIKRSSLMIPTPTQFVRSSLATTGIETVTCGYYMHKLQLYGIEILQQYLPPCVLNKVIFNSMWTLRSKYLRKMAKKE